MLHIPEKEKASFEQKHQTPDEQAAFQKKEEELNEMIKSTPKNPLAYQAKKAFEKNEESTKSMPTIIDKFEIPTLLIFYLCICWVLGYFHFHPLWFIGALFSMIFLYKRRLQRFVELELYGLRREAAKNAISSHEESAEWINYIIGRIWGVYEPVLSATIVESVNEALEDACPVFLNSLKLTTFTLGSEPPVILGFRSYPETSDDIVHFEVRFAFVPRRSTDDIMYPLRRGTSHRQWSSQVVLAARFGSSLVGVDVPVLVENISVEVHARIQLKLMAAPPVVKIAQISLMTPPKIDFVLKPLKSLDIMDLPGLHSFIKSTIESVSSEIAVNPNSILINVDELVNGAILASQKPSGVLCIGIIGAKIPKSSEYIGTVDPFISIIINGIETARTKELVDQQNPLWGETFWILLPNDKSEVKLQVIHGSSLVTKEITLGQLILDIPSILEHSKKGNDNTVTPESLYFSGWAPYLSLDGDPPVEKGQLQYSVAFFPALGWTDPVADPFTYTDGPGILDFTLHQAVELTPKKSTHVKAMNVYAEGAIVPTHLVDSSLDSSGGGIKLKLESFANVPSSYYFKTRTKKKTNSPIWSQRIKAFVKDGSSYSLWIQFREERDLAGPSLIGQVILSLADNLLQKDTSQEDDWFSIGSNFSGKVRLTYTWDPVMNLEDAESFEAEVSGGESSGTARIPSIALAHVTILEAEGFSSVYSFKSNVYIRTSIYTAKGGTGGGEPVLITRNVSPPTDLGTAPPRVVWLDGTWAFVKDLDSNVVFELFESISGGNIFKSTPVGQYSKQKDHLLASSIIKVSDIVKDPAAFLNCWLDLQTSAKEEFCRLRIELAIWPTLSPEKPIQEKHYIGILRIKLLRMDGFVDPSESIKPSHLITGLKLVDFNNERDADEDITLVEDISTGEFVSTGAKKGSSKQPEWKESFEWIVLDLHKSSIAISVRARCKKGGTKKKMNIISIGNMKLNIQDIIAKQLSIQSKSINASNDSGNFWPFTDFNSNYFVKDNELSTAGLWMDIVFRPLDIDYCKTDDGKEALNDLLSFISTEEIPGYVVLRLQSAADLVAADSSGTSDPFTVINLNGIKVGKSSVIKKTLNPEWNERFVLPVRSLRYAILGLEIFDWNRIDSFVHIGTLSVPLLRMILESALKKKVSNSSTAFYRNLPSDAISDIMLAESTWPLVNTEHGSINLQVAFVENAMEFTSLTENLHSSGGLITSTKGFFKGVGSAFVGGATTIVAAPFTGGKFLAKKGLGLFSRPGKVKSHDAIAETSPIMITTTSSDQKHVNFENADQVLLHNVHYQLKGVLFGENILKSQVLKEDETFYIKVRRMGTLIAKSKPEKIELKNKIFLLEDTPNVHFEMPLFERHNEPIIFHTKFTSSSKDEEHGNDDTVLGSRFVFAPDDFINIDQKKDITSIWLQEVNGDEIAKTGHESISSVSKESRSEISKSFAFEELLQSAHGKLFDKFKSKIIIGPELPESIKASGSSFLSLHISKVN